MLALLVVPCAESRHNLLLPFQHFRRKLQFWPFIFLFIICPQPHAHSRFWSLPVYFVTGGDICSDVSTAAKGPKSQPVHEGPHS